MRIPFVDLPELMKPFDCHRALVRVYRGAKRTDPIAAVGHIVNDDPLFIIRPCDLKGE